MAHARFNPLLDSTNLFLLTNEEKLNVTFCRQGLGRQKSFETLLDETLNAGEDSSRETLIFQTFTMPSDGRKLIELPAPDKFVTYKVQAVSIHPKSGVAFSEPKKIEIFKPLVVGVDPMPARMFQDEILTVNVHIETNVETKDKVPDVIVEFTGTDDFEVIMPKNKKDVFCQYASSNTTVEIPYAPKTRLTFYLRPKRNTVGSTKVSFVATSVQGRDGSVQNVEVEASEHSDEIKFTEPLRGGLKETQHSFDDEVLPMVEVSAKRSGNKTMYLKFKGEYRKHDVQFVLERDYQDEGFTMKKGYGVDIEYEGAGEVSVRMYPRISHKTTKSKGLEIDTGFLLEKNKYVLKMQKSKSMLRGVAVVSVKLPGNYELVSSSLDLEKALKGLSDVRNMLFCIFTYILFINIFFIFLICLMHILVELHRWIPRVDIIWFQVQIEPMEKITDSSLLFAKA